MEPKEQERFSAAAAAATAAATAAAAAAAAAAGRDINKVAKVATTTPATKRLKKDANPFPSAAAASTNNVGSTNGSAHIDTTSGVADGSLSSTSTGVSRKRPRVGAGSFNGTEDWLIHPPDGSAPIDLRKEAEAIFNACQLSICRDVVFELHRELHTGILTTERLWAERLHPPPKPKPGGDVYGRVPPKEPSTNITCPSCGRAVGAARYAPHLDKCALGSSRGRSSRARGSPTPSDRFKPIESSASSSKAPFTKISSGSRLPPLPPASNRPSSAKPSKPPPASNPNTNSNNHGSRPLGSSTTTATTPATSSSSGSSKPQTAKAGSSQSPSVNVPAAGNAKASANAKVSSSNRNSKSKASSRPGEGSVYTSVGGGFRYTRAPPPPLPAQVPPDKKKETLHILIKLVGGVPVQTYHRVLLTAPKGDKAPSQPLELPQSPPPRSSSFSRSNSFSEDHRGGPCGSRSSPPSPRLAAVSNNSNSRKVGGWGGGGSVAGAVGARCFGREGSNPTAAAAAAVASGPLPMSAYKDRRFVDARSFPGGRGEHSRTDSGSGAFGAGYFSYQTSARGSGAISGSSTPALPPPPSPLVRAGGSGGHGSGASSTNSRIPPMLISASGSSPRSPPAAPQQHRPNGASSPRGGGGGGGSGSQGGPGSLGRKDGSRHSVRA